MFFLKYWFLQMPYTVPLQVPTIPKASRASHKSSHNNLSGNKQYQQRFHRTVRPRSGRHV